MISIYEKIYQEKRFGIVDLAGVDHVRLGGQRAVAGLPGRERQQGDLRGGGHGSRTAQQEGGVAGWVDYRHVVVRHYAI